MSQSNVNRVLKEEGMRNSDILLVTGNKNESSVSRSVRHRSDAAIRFFSVALTRAHSEVREELKERNMVKLNTSYPRPMKDTFSLEIFYNWTLSLPAEPVLSIVCFG